MIMGTTPLITQVGFRRGQTFHSLPRFFLPLHCSTSVLPGNQSRFDPHGTAKKIYIHCRGGHDRTGAVVVAYFIYQGFSPAEAKERFRDAFLPSVKGRYPHRPLIETDWNVLERY